MYYIAALRLLLNHNKREMESHCAAPLYRAVEGNLEITTRSCSQVLYQIGQCDASYLYLNSRFLYTFACPIADVSKRERNGRQELSSNTTTPPSFFTNATTIREEERKNATFLRGRMNASLSYYNNNSKNATQNITQNASKLFVYSVREQSNKDTAPSSENIPPAFAVTLVIFSIVMSVLSFAVFMYVRKRNQTALKKTIQRRPSSIMPEVIKKTSTSSSRSSVTREVKAVLNKMIKTVCRWNGEEPYRQKAPESAPPLPPRPPRTGKAVNKRQETLAYLRRTTPHLSIQKALNKPSENFGKSGQRRAELLRREAALEARRQQSRHRRSRSRLENIVRLRDLHKKTVAKDGEKGALSQKEEQREDVGGLADLRP